MLETGQPRTWLLMGHKAGDNTQVLALAEGLGWPYEIKRLVYRKTELLSNLLLGPTLAGIQREKCSALSPPWPDLIITAGRRNEPVARWIRQQSDRTVYIVHLGRPWAKLRHFDLIITTPQYLLPQAANILHNSLPLHRVTPRRLQEDAEVWSKKFMHLPRPWYALLLGGNSGPFTLDPAKAEILSQGVIAMVKQQSGSLLITSSARTPTKAIELLAHNLDTPHYLHRWQAGQQENPYFAYLALADAFIVTGDSISMLTEACVTRKPVYIFDLADGPQARRPRQLAANATLPWWRYRYNYRFRPLSHRLGMWLGPRRMRRDVQRMHAQLIQEGRAAWLGDPFPANTTPPQLTDLSQAVQRVRSLFQK